MFSIVRMHRAWCRGRNKAFSLAISREFAGFGDHSVIALPVQLDGAEHIRVGSGVYVGPYSWLHTIVTDGAPTPRIEIEDGVSVTGALVLSAAQHIRLGAGVLIARNVYIADHSHAFGHEAQPILDQGIDKVKPVDIGEGAWLGQNVVVGPGVRIGRGAVVGANAVVLDDVPDRSVAVGAPARVIRSIDP